MGKNVTLYSWASYDFANTIFSAVVLTAYFPLYLTDLTGANWYLGAATTLSMVAAGAVVPFLGALSDQTGKTKSYLIRTTLLSIFFLSLITFAKSPFILIAIFLAACFFFHASLVFYNSLLPVVASPEKQGFASGLGTGLGYLGVVLSLPVAHWIDQSLGRPYVFLGAAVLFLLFSLPLFFLVPERKVSHPIRFEKSLWREEWGKILTLMRALPEQPHLLLFFGGHFFVVDALNSMIFWFLVYAREVFSPGQSALIHLLITVNIGAFLAGFLSGFLVDRFGAMKTLLLASGSLVVTLMLLSVIPDFKTFSVISITGGAFAIAGIWTSGRKVLLELAPKDKIGKYFGIYGLTTKVSIIGSLVFSIVADLADFRSALWILVFPAVVGWFFLFGSWILQKKLSFPRKRESNT